MWHNLTNHPAHQAEPEEPKKTPDEPASGEKPGEEAKKKADSGSG
jgi:hypothetical protein